MPDNGGFRHYVDKVDMQQARLAQEPIQALCGWIWIPQKSTNSEDDSDNLPVCPDCEAVYETLLRRAQSKIHSDTRPDEPPH
jgi:hypothetical protein